MGGGGALRRRGRRGLTHRARLAARLTNLADRETGLAGWLLRLPAWVAGGGWLPDWRAGGQLWYAATIHAPYMPGVYP